MATTTKPRNPNGTRNGVTSKAAKPNGTASATKAKTSAIEETPETHAAALLKELWNLVFKEYGVKLQHRDARVSPTLASYMDCKISTKCAIVVPLTKQPIQDA